MKILEFRNNIIESLFMGSYGSYNDTFKWTINFLSSVRGFLFRLSCTFFKRENKLATNNPQPIFQNQKTMTTHLINNPWTLPLSIYLSSIE